MNKTKTLDTTNAAASETASRLQNKRENDNRHEKTVRWQIEGAGFAIVNAAALIDKLISANDSGVGEPIDANLLGFLNSTIKTNAELLTDIMSEYNEISDLFIGISSRVSPHIYTAGATD